jgi:hypothetical protein
MTDRKMWGNRKERKEWARRLQSEDPGLEVVHPHAAGIDVGNGMHYVAVRPDRDPQPVCRFECFTADLHRLADWLQRCGVKTVAMQSTGVYCIPIYEILEARGIQVYLVNARHTKNLPGRKSDVQESQWLLKLHSYGLLNNSFQPPSEIRVLRTYWRQRGDHVHGAATCIQRMRKALTQMNVQLANVISDVSGLTGQTIVRSIVAGEHDPRKMAELSDPRIHASREEVAKSDTSPRNRCGAEGDARTDAPFNNPRHSGYLHPGGHHREADCAGRCGSALRYEKRTPTVIGANERRTARELMPFWSLFVPTKGWSLFCKCLNKMAGTTRLELATSAVTARHTRLISDLHSRGGCQVAERDCRNRSLWVNLWVRIFATTIGCLVFGSMTQHFLGRNP